MPTPQVERSPAVPFALRRLLALTLLRRLLLLPLLAPLLVVLLVAAFNPRPIIAMRLLTVRSPALPLGLWMAAAGGGGALLSALATTLALREGSRRSSGRPSPEREPWSEEPAPSGRGRQGFAPEAAASPSRSVEPQSDSWPGAGPQRAPGEPPPTVSVPFRVISRPARSGASAVSAPPSSHPNETAEVASAQSAGPDDWNDVASDDDW